MGRQSFGQFLGADFGVSRSDSTMSGRSVGAGGAIGAHRHSKESAALGFHSSGSLPDSKHLTASNERKCPPTLTKSAISETGFFCFEVDFRVKVVFGHPHKVGTG